MELEAWPKNGDPMRAAIKAIKVDGPNAAARDALRAASEELAGMGASLQFVACSEFSLIADAVAPTVKAVDTVDLLAQKIVEVAQFPAADTID